MNFITEIWFIEGILIVFGAIVFVLMFCKGLNCCNKDEEENKWH